MALEKQTSTAMRGDSPSAIAQSTELVPLRAKAGPIQRIGTKIAISAEAGRALRHVEKKKVWAEAGIAETAIELSAARVRTALVSTAMPAIGSLAVHLNNATAAVDEALSNAAAGEVASHIENRHRNLALADQLHSAGKLSDDEKVALVGFAQADAVEDIERSRKRMAEGKAAVEKLHERALSGIEKVKAGFEG